MFELILQTPTDSVATAIGGTVGVFVGVKLAAILGIISKFATDLLLKVKGMEQKLPKAVKPFVALGVTMGLSFVNGHLAHLGGPQITDSTVIPALIAWGIAMGFHSLVNALIKPKAA